MNIGVFADRRTVDKLVVDAELIKSYGYRSMWCPQVFNMDTLTALAVLSDRVPGIDLGTAVVPTYLRHPVMMASQARTVQQVSGGRLTLGIGLSHKQVIEGVLGLSWETPVRHMREYLEVLMPLLRGEFADLTGEMYRVRAGLNVPSDDVPVIVAALGTQMLNVAGRLADGTATWMTGLETVANHVVPTINAAAAGAGKPEPRVVVALPTCVTDDVAAAKDVAAVFFQIYGQLPSYRAMLDREGAKGPEDVAIIGSADHVQEKIAAFFEAGATEFVLVPFHERERTMEALTPLLA